MIRCVLDGCRREAHAHVQCGLRRGEGLTGHYCAAHVETVVRLELERALMGKRVWLVVEPLKKEKTPQRSELIMPAANPPAKNDDTAAALGA